MFGYQIKNNQDNIYKNKYIQYANSKGISLEQMFHKKYLLYKEKYLKLKAKYEQTGGTKPMSNVLKGINLFTDPDMEQYLNPIYGVIACESGYIKNNFYLHEAGLINTPESQVITRVSRKIPGSIQPIKDILKKVKAGVIGKYMGFLYVSKSQWFKDLGAKAKALTKIVTSQAVSKEEKDKAIAESKAIQQLIKELNVSNKENIFGVKPDTDSKELFHIILYCLWWIAYNKNGIKKYYEGINEVFTTVNKFSPNQFPLITIPENFASNSFTTKEIKEQNNDLSFELIIAKLTEKLFNMFDQSYAKSYCSDPIDYADCGETTIRNLLNLIAYDHVKDKFIVDRLRKLGAIDQVIEYYNTFNTFADQASEELLEIYDEKLNARDAWSKLIIFYANKNIRYVKTCSTTNVSFELNSGMSADGSKSNLLQVLSNLLTKVKSFNDLANETNNILEVYDETTNGVGIITIQHKIYDILLLDCSEVHYYMKLPKKEMEIDGIDNLLTPNQIEYYNIFVNRNINETNYMWYDISADLLPDYINDLSETNYRWYGTPFDKLPDYRKYPLSTQVRSKLLELSLTEQYNPDVRRRIRINANILDLNQVVNSSLITQYKFSSENYDFLLRYPQLDYLIDKITITNKAETIDLTPLCKIKKIGNNFLHIRRELKYLDLTPLANVNSIGNNFLSDCELIESLDLSPLKQITEMNDWFLSNLSKLKSINLLQLNLVTKIGKSVLVNCSKLTSVDLSGLKNLSTIGKSFMFRCINLQSINLSGLSKLQNIGDDFLESAESLETIDFTSLINLEKIGQGFMKDARMLKEINLSKCSKLAEIKSDFLRNNSKCKIICTEKQKPIILQNNRNLEKQIQIV